jgi:hypothetical protein
MKIQTKQHPINPIKKNILNSKKFHYCQYSLLFGVSLFSTLAIVFGINCFVDPYKILPHQSWSELFKIKPDLENHIRLSKYMQVSYLKPNVLFLGSSRVAGGMTKAEKALGENQVVYNLTVYGE